MNAHTLLDSDTETGTHRCDGDRVASTAEPLPRTVRGVVVAINFTDTPHTIVVRVLLPNKEELIVRADVLPETGITCGKRSVSLSDIKTGDVANVTYSKNPEDELVARSIHAR